MTYQFENGASYGTLNSYRSAIAQISDPNMASDFRLRRFFKGVFGMRPPLARYEHTWDPDIVLSYVRLLQNKDISLEILTQKLAILLALVTGQRIQTLGLIDVRNIFIHTEKIEIKITNRVKTSAVNRPQPLLVLPFYKKDPHICVGSTLLEYLKRTKDLRGDGTFLFITFKKPHRKASPQTISRWIGIMLKKSGLDTSQFKPQSTRHASTSKVARAGVSFDTIRLAAGWSEKSKTFANFYNRPVFDNTRFAKTVLSLDS